MEFTPNRTKKNIRIIYWICIPFTAIGLLLSGGEFFSAGMLFGLFSFAILLLGHFFTAPRNVIYKIDADAIFLRARKKEISIPFGEIEAVHELKEKEAEEFMLKLKLKEETEERDIVFGEKGKGMNPFERLREAFKVQAKAYSPYKFLSVPIMYKGKKGERHTKGVNLPCDCAFILMKSGEGFLISPLDTAGFVSEAKKYLPA